MLVNIFLFIRCNVNVNRGVNRWLRRMFSYHFSGICLCADPLICLFVFKNLFVVCYIAIILVRYVIGKVTTQTHTHTHTPPL